MGKTMLSVSVDLEALDLVKKKVENISGFVNEQLWAKAKEGSFSKDDLEQAGYSIEEVLKTSVVAGEREKVAQRENEAVAEELKPFLEPQFYEQYREIVGKIKEKMPDTGSNTQKLMFWKEVLEECRKLVIQ